MSAGGGGGGALIGPGNPGNHTYNLWKRTAKVKIMRTILGILRTGDIIYSQFHLHINHISLKNTNPYLLSPGPRLAL